jgi:tungstate transport system ATP-binding protein
MSDIPLLQGKDLLVKKGKATLLETDCFQVHPGEILALLGPNGAGKTTLMKILSLLEKPSRGEIIFRGERIDWKKNLVPFRRRMGVVFQSPLLFDTTVYQNVAAGLRFRRVQAAESEGEVREVLRQMGIAGLAGRHARKLSGGEAFRVSLARAFVLKPEILFLDEPFSSLDPPTRESLLNDLEMTLRRTGTTTVFVTHDCSEAIRLADRIAVMHEGRILQMGPAEEVANFPANELVAQFFGVETILSGKVKESNSGSFVALVGPHDVEAAGEALPGEEVVLCIRPENVTISTLPLHRENLSARNLFPGTIRRVTLLGHTVRLGMDCGFPLSAYVTRHSLTNLRLQEGTKVYAHFKATAIHVIRKGH